MAADRSPFIDQSQSLNVHIANPNYANMSSMHFYGWKAVMNLILILFFQSKLVIYKLNFYEKIRRDVSTIPGTKFFNHIFRLYRV